jgi:hypothetical protein
LVVVAEPLATEEAILIRALVALVVAEPVATL